jgi:hypothetical protein
MGTSFYVKGLSPSQVKMAPIYFTMCAVRLQAVFPMRLDSQKNPLFITGNRGIFHAIPLQKPHHLRKMVWICLQKLLFDSSNCWKENSLKICGIPQFYGNERVNTKWFPAINLRSGNFLGMNGRVSDGRVVGEVRTAKLFQKKGG